MQGCYPSLACASGTCVASDATSTAVLFGGEDGNETLQGQTWSWDGTQWTQLLVTGPTPRAGAMMATLHGVTVLYGGSGANGDLADTWTFDGSTWTELTIDGPPARDSGMFAAFDHKLVLYGGEYFDSDRNNGHNFDDTWIFDGSTWEQVQATGTGGLNSAAMAQLGDNLVLFGGAACNASTNMMFECADEANTWTFDGSNWSEVEVAGPPRRETAALAAYGNSLVLYGGYTVESASTCGGLDDGCGSIGAGGRKLRGCGSITHRLALHAG